MTEAAELAARVREIYQQLIAVDVNNASLRAERPGCVDGAAGAALSGALCAEDKQDGPDPLQVAAYLLRSLVKNHCFQDGNKRLAWSAALDYLHQNGYGISSPQDEAAYFVESIASGKLTAPRDIATWLAERLTDIDV